jgi:hypothetical protein
MDVFRQLVVRVAESPGHQANSAVPGMGVLVCPQTNHIVLNP